MACTHGEISVELAKALGDLARLTADNEALRKDVERYRWLRGRAYRDGIKLVIDVTVVMESRLLR